jgi:hypothetical protein
MRIVRIDEVWLPARLADLSDRAVAEEAVCSACSDVQVEWPEGQA